jgi:hypothetical protein
MRIAALVASRNRPDLVEATVAQLSRSALPVDTFVVECGTDPEKLSPHAAVCYPDPGFRGKCYGHNVGLQLARLDGAYDYYWVLMNDLVFDEDGPDPIATLVATMERDPRLAVLSPTCEDGAYPGSARRPGGGWRPVSTCDYLALMVRGAAVGEVGFLDPAFTYCWGAIHDYAYRLYSCGWVVGYSDDVTYRHLGGTTYGAPGTKTIARDEYQRQAAAFAAEHMMRAYGPGWDDRFWSAAGGHGIETNTFALHRRYWESLARDVSPARAPEAEPTAPREPVRVHLGSGSDYRPGWLNVDTDEACNPDVLARAEALPMLDTDSVDVLEACHLFEHLTFGEAHGALREWSRVLRPGGELFLELPDLAASVALLGQHVDDGGYDLGMVGIYGWPPDVEAHGTPMMHKWGWTRDTIARALEGAGFARVEFPPTTQSWRPADRLGRNMRVRAVNGQLAAAPAPGRAQEPVLRALVESDPAAPPRPRITLGGPGLEAASLRGAAHRPT